eukprot:1157295-Pyramimonas_sp.AAC.1
MSCEVSGWLNLVMTDPSKPMGYEKRLDVELPCTLFIIGGSPTSATPGQNPEIPSEPAEPATVIHRAGTPKH